MGYHSQTLLRFIAYALPLLVLLLALFGFTVELLDVEPSAGSVIRLALFEQPRVPARIVLGAWLMEASGLLALFLVVQGRCGAWWLDSLVAGWLGWIFRGPLLVMTIVVAAGQPHRPWWSLAFGWWVLYSVCGLTLGLLARRMGLGAGSAPDEGMVPASPPSPEPRQSRAVEPPADTAPAEPIGGSPEEDAATNEDVAEAPNDEPADPRRDEED